LLEERDMPQKVSMVKIKELKYLEIECPKCGTMIGLDVTRTNFFPEKCPACPAMFDGFTGSLPQAFRQYIEFYRTFSESALAPRFRVSGNGEQVAD
jgi:predicted RNA-binding Zn-ribbon protein involved in translation (DUF1610 family)